MMDAKFFFQSINLLFIVFGLISCNQSSSNKDTNLSNVRSNIADDTVIIRNASFCRKPFEPEIAINQIELLNPKSLLNRIDQPTFQENDEDSFPNIILYNKGKTQKLTLLFYPGSSNNDVSYFILEKINNQNNTDKEISVNMNDSIFLTNNDFTLDMSGDIIKKKYMSNNIELLVDGNEPNVILTYFTDDYKNDHLLKKYNMPIYIAKYHLINNRVTKLEFGFEYP